MRVKLSRRTLVQAGTAALASVALPSLAQSAWPSKPIRILVGYSAGGGVDTMARLLAPHLSTQLGQQVVVEFNPDGATDGLATAQELAGTFRDQGRLLREPYADEVEAALAHFGYRMLLKESFLDKAKKALPTLWTWM